MTFGAAEHRILDMFKIGTRFIFDDIEYVVTVSGKPTCSKGEPKTDIYIAAKSSVNTIKEFKISSNWFCLLLKFISLELSSTCMLKILFD